MFGFLKRKNHPSVNETVLVMSGQGVAVNERYNTPATIYDYTTKMVVPRQLASNILQYAAELYTANELGMIGVRVIVSDATNENAFETWFRLRELAGEIQLRQDEYSLHLVMADSNVFIFGAPTT